MKEIKLQPPPGNPDTADPEARDKYLAQPEVRQQELADTKRLTELSRKSVQEYLERQRMTEEAEKRGEAKGELKTLMSLLLEHVIGIDVVKRQLNAETDVEVEKKIQKMFPDFHFPATS
ncbi:MAG: hypothetical protein ABFS56_10880 [Pseudomonadota bacterium]